MKVVVTDYIESDLDWEAELLRKAGHAFQAHQLKFRPDAEILEAIGDADVVVVNMVKMTDAILTGMKRCRLLIRHGIGYDNVDVEACTRAGIVFAYQPDYCVEDVAEHAIALILACGRKLIPSRAVLDKSVVTGQWDFTGLFPLYRMAGKTLGIVGVGRIGSRVAQKLAGFGFRIVGCDPYLSPERKKEIGIEWMDLDDLLRVSDYVTVHTLLRDETRHMINARTLGLMKETAYLINTSRGGMVDVDALRESLRQGRIAGAALDVYEREPPPPELGLYDLPNVILTPHTAWASEESGQAIRKSILDDILAAAEGRLPRNQVNKGVPLRRSSDR